MSIAALPQRAPAEVPADPLDLLPVDAVVAVAMSGGVDSSVAAARCVERGLATVGVTLAMWPRDAVRDRDRGCCSVDAVEDARRVCATLGIPHYAWNLEDGFRREVIADFEQEYAAGRTPNPCVRCNERVKFGLLRERALAVGATHVATGHYARIGVRGDLVTLHRGADSRKDQAYTLCLIGQEGLRRAAFPVGGFASKAEVRAEASRLGLATAAKPDSQELCFVAGRLRDDLAVRLRDRYAPGELVDAAGLVVGSHDGLPFLTVGQRSGLRLRAGRPDAAPAYVLRLDPSSNRAIVGPREALGVRLLAASGCVWFGSAPAVGEEVGVQVRSHGGATAGRVVATAAGSVRVEVDEPVAAAAPGQALVLLDPAGDEVLGGGILETP
jgi:tRNA-specific 2-thiouridylase